MKYHVQDFVDCKLLILELLHLRELSIINNFSNSIKLALDSKIVNINKSKTKISLKNKKVLSSFEDIELDMYIVENYLKNVDPDWVYFVKQGFKEVENYAPKRMKIIFSNLNLFDVSNKRVRNWWISLRSLNETSNYKKLQEIGNEGEEIVLIFEKNRTKKDPVRMSLQSDRYGYDILSYKNINSDKKIRIEVKNCESRKLHFFISRNEYENSNSLNYYFYFIDSRNKNARILYIFQNNLIKNDISKDQGKGSWSSIKIPMNKEKLDKCKKVELN
tara:strand:+ start:23 stop:847 length:825 start_codon:yes stop_codon:yes gene_type:complete